MVTSPLSAAEVKPVPSPISIWVSATAFADIEPKELASLTNTVLAGTCWNLANVTPSDALVEVFTLNTPEPVSYTHLTLPTSDLV